MEETRKRPKISVYMITFNNERTVEKALASVQWADEIVVVDSYSTDRTVEISRKFTDRVVQRPWPGFRDQYQYAADLTIHEWIMFVDADEEVSRDLAQEIRTVVNKDGERRDGFIVYRHTYYLGRWIRYGGWNPDYEIRLYRREKGRWEGGLHAKVWVGGKVGSLAFPYLHYPYRDISDQIQRADQYSRMAAEDMLQGGERFSLKKLIFHPPFRFVKEYLFKSGFRDGVPGLVIITITMFYAFMKYAKLWELTRSTAAGQSFEKKAGKHRSGATPSPRPMVLREIEESDQGAEGLSRAPQGERK